MPDIPFVVSEIICLGNRIKKTIWPMMFRDISRADFFVMNQIACHRNHHPEVPGIYASELAARSHVSRAAISRQLQQLENRGWIARCADPHSKRNVFVYLTDEGKAVIENQHAEGDAFFERVINRVGEDRMQEALELFRDIVSAMEEEAKHNDSEKGVCE